MCISTAGMKMNACPIHIQECASTFSHFLNYSCLCKCDCDTFTFVKQQHLLLYHIISSALLEMSVAILVSEGYADNTEGVFTFLHVTTTTQ